MPWVVADENGYFAEEGISVTIQAPATVSDSVKFLSVGRADVAFTTSLDVVLAVAEGGPVRSIGAVTQFNNCGLVVEEGTPTDIESLEGEKIGIYNDAWTTAQLETMLASGGLTLDDVTLVPAPDSTGPLLMTGQVRAATGITNAEFTEVEVLGDTPPVMILAADHGVPNIYVQVLAAGNAWLEDNPDVAAGFMRAVQKGTEYSISNPDDALRIFNEVYPGALDAEYAAASWANTLPLFSSTDTDAHGFYWNNVQRWQELVDFAVAAELLDAPVPVEDLFVNVETGE